MGPVAVKVSFVICGVEHSGTTLLSDLFRQVSGIESGFECGVLLGRSPRDFPGLQPFFANMFKGWQIQEADLRACCDTDEFNEFYDRLSARSKIIGENVTTIFDKTPRYFSCLSECLTKLEVPFLCAFKDPRAMVYSDMVRAKPDSFDKWYERYVVRKKNYIAQIYSQAARQAVAAPQRVLTVRLEDVCLDTRQTLERVFTHVGLDFETRYLLVTNRRYKHNKDSSIVAGMPFEYRIGLTRSQIGMIETDFSDFPLWFYD